MGESPGESWPRIKELFHRALDLGAAERARMLEEACGPDAALRREVESLLAAHARSGAFLDADWQRTSAAHGGVPTDAQPRLAPGKRLGRYEVRELIGSGGMGEVYRARDQSLDRDVAIKVLPQATAADPEALARFAREAKAVAALSHPNILAIYDVGSEDGTVFAVMELLKGETLRARLSRAGPLAWPEAVGLAAALAEGLGAAHAEGIVHCDLKPENVFLTPDGHPKVLDFGLARRPPAAATGQGAFPTEQLGTLGLVMGTIGYMSPEQVQGQPADGRSDVFSLGCMLFELIAGRPPFAITSAAGFIAAVLTEQPPRLGPAVPPQLDEVIACCLARRPADRFQSARDLARALRATLTGAYPAHAAARAWWRRPAALLIPLALVAAGAVVGLRRPSSPGTGAAREEAPSVAVLPFQAVGAAPEDDYFTDGMTEALTTELAGVAGLRVMARDSTAAYKGNVDVKKVAAELGVRYVVRGSARREAGRLRAQVQLIDAAGGFHVWADRYDRDLRDVFAVQEDIARNVTRALRVALRGPADAGHEPPTANLEAYDAYLQGRYAFRKADDAFDRAGMREAIGLLERAVALDQRFAIAQADLGWAYARLSFNYDADPAWERKAAAAVQKALALDPDLAEGYNARARLIWTLANGFPHHAAMADLRRALAIRPSYADAHRQLALVYWHIGLFDETLRESERALQLNPTDTTSASYIARVHLARGEFAAVLAQYDALPGFEARLRPTGDEKTMALLYLGRDAEALERAQARVKAAGSHDPGGALAISELAIVRARRGETAAAEAAIAEALRRGRGFGHMHHAEYNVALAYVALGRRGEALRFIQQAVSDGFPCYPQYANDPFLAPLRDDPAFRSFLDGLRERWQRNRSLAGLS